jgi:hypothetical protein
MPVPLYPRLAEAAQAMLVVPGGGISFHFGLILDSPIG